MSVPPGNPIQPQGPALAQCAQRVLMVRPSRFGFNAETAQSNRFQVQPAEACPDEIHDQALREFDSLCAALDQAGITAHVFEDDPLPHTPDAIFPNNWVSFHGDGSLVYYPLMAENRRPELRRDWIARLQQDLGHPWTREIDLTPMGAEGAFLEGTGSLILDHAQRIAYAGLSNRTTRVGLSRFQAASGYQVLAFDTRDGHGLPIYHTNVMMALGESHAVVCIDAVWDPAQRKALLDALEAAHKEVLPIDLEQVAHFAGNQLALRSQDGDPVILLSRSALRSLRPDQVRRLEHHATLAPVALDTIEAYGGGSARCMMAELHMP